MNKIQEILVEPNVIRTGSYFKLKIKILDKLNYALLKKYTYAQAKELKYNDLIGKEN